MPTRPSYNRVWGAGIPPPSCDHCHRDEPVWYISSRPHPELNGAGGYYCIGCVVGLFKEAMALEGFLLIDVRGAAGVIINDIELSPIEEEQLRKQRDWHN